MVDVGQQLSQQAQQVQVPQTAQTLAEQAFETAVQPTRREFQERLTGTLEGLSRRGIQFGELGSENIQDLLRRQSEQERQLAGQIGTRLGQTQLEQAFAASEAAKNRSLQRELTERGFEFQAGERGIEREFATGERLGREAFAGKQAELERGARLGEAAAGREFAAEQAALGREFAAGESQLGREFTTGEAKRARQFTAEQQALGRTFEESQAELGRDFAAEQALLGRTFSAEEDQKQRDFTQKSQQAGFEFAASEADLNRQQQKNQTALQLALEGQLTGPQVQSVLDQTFGPGTVLTTNDEKDLRRAAVASGLSESDYLKVRQAIGQGQLTAVLDNPQDFVDNPQASRDFQVNMAKMSIDAALDAARITAQATTEAARQAAQSAKDESLFSTIGTVIGNQNRQIENLINSSSGKTGSSLEQKDVFANLGSATGQAVFGDLGGAVGGLVDDLVGGAGEAIGGLVGGIGNFFGGLFG